MGVTHLGTNKWHVICPDRFSLMSGQNPTLSWGSHAGEPNPDVWHRSLSAAAGHDGEGVALATWCWLLLWTWAIVVWLLLLATICCPYIIRRYDALEGRILASVWALWKDPGLPRAVTGIKRKELPTVTEIRILPFNCALGYEGPSVCFWQMLKQSLAPMLMDLYSDNPLYKIW